MPDVTSVAVFCGSSDGVADHHLDLARKLGSALAERSVRVVYGGGNTGLMGAIAAGAMGAGGEVIGVIPGGLFSNGANASEVTELEVVATMHERKDRMYELSDAFVGLPGGLGTLEEIFEAATWSQIGLHGGRAKPTVLVDVDGFWSPVVEFLDRADAEGFLRTGNRELIAHADSVAAALACLGL